MHNQLNLDVALRVAQEAAYEAGSYCRQESVRVRDKDRMSKGPLDFYTYVDVKAEEIIVEHIRKYFPEHSILGEETGFVQGNDQGKDVVWHIDPLDGTNNYLHKVPLYCTSIGLTYQDNIKLGVIYAPEQNEMYRAADGDGAFLNDRRIRTRISPQLANAMIVFGFPHRGLAKIKKNFAKLLPILTQAGGVRRYGSAALDLAWLARGGVDAYVEFDLNMYDFCAGVMIAQEAGAQVSGLTAKEDFRKTGNLIVAPPSLHRQLAKLLESSAHA